MKRILSSMLIFMSAIGLSGCWGGNNWHQKLTVTVATPQGDVSGSAVTAVSLQFPGDTILAPGYAYQGGYSGEAVAVKVAPGKYLFALLDERLTTLAIKVFVSAKAGASPMKQDANAVEAVRERRALPPADYPLLVTFTDINDPKSVKEVKPAMLADIFGTGYSLKSVTLEITDEAKIKGQAARILPWLKDMVGTNLDGSNTSNNPGGLWANIGDGNFRTEK
jgi:hypothetical protein